MNLSPIQTLIKADIDAYSEFNRQFNLQDMGLTSSEVEIDALNRSEETLMAICRARPNTPDDEKLWRCYLDKELLKRIEGDPNLIEQTVHALIGKRDAP